MSQNSPPDRAQVSSGKTQPSWWWFFALLLIWNLIAFWPHNHTQTEIPYSTFLAQARAGNVAKVNVTGDTITGEFKKPYTPPKTSATASPTQAASQTTPQTYSSFRTIVPSTLGEPLQALLQSQNVEVDASSTAAPWYLNFLVSWLPLLLLGGYFIWMLGSAGRKQMGMMSSLGAIKSQARVDSDSGVSFADVAGAGEAKAELQEEVDFLRKPEKYLALGARIPRGILLVGAPGTGKTLLARAIAGEAKVPFFSLNASEFVEMFVGVGASRVRDLFAKAKAAAPAIVFIDELDAVGRRRGAGLGTVNDEREQTLNQLLGELDGFDSRSTVIILAATNRPDVLDPALLRPGRFDRQVVIDLPDADDRLGILQLHARKLKIAQDVDLSFLARGTIGFSGADLANLCNEAALAAARHDRAAVTMADFEEAGDKIRLGATHRRLVDPAERRIVAYHESGHAITAWFTAHADPVQKVTIVPRGQALGLTEQVPDTERRNLSLSYLNARLSVMLSGRAAEEIALGEITTGAENDLIEATKLARRMVTRWGMGDLGLIAFKVDEEQPFLGYELAQGHDYSETTAAAVDRNVRVLLEKAHAEVRALLADHRDLLDRLAAELLKAETVGPEELQRLLGSRVVLGAA